MKFDGNAPVYSAFALVAIESIWPNIEGNELAPDTFDMFMLGTQPLTQKGKARPGLSVSGANNNKSGYYKLLPLNVISVATESSINGSNFTVVFTLNDLIIVTADDSFLKGAGLPLGATSIVKEGGGVLPILDSLTNSAHVNWKYVKDESLGLTRYRVSGTNSNFTIEDLVDINDTVTIWIYCDPQEFYTKDEAPFVVGDTLEPSSNIRNIVGSADRRTQFATESPTFDETLLGTLGLINESVAEIISRQISEEGTADRGQVNSITRDNIAGIVNSFVQAALASEQLITTPTDVPSPEGTVQNEANEEAAVEEEVAPAPQTPLPRDYVAKRSLRNYTQQALSAKDRDPVGDTANNAIFNHFLSRYITTPELDAPIEGRVQTETAANQLSKQRQLLDALLSDWLPDGTGGNLLGVPSDAPTIDMMVELGMNTEEDRQAFVYSANMFAKRLNERVNEYVTTYKEKRKIRVSRQVHDSGRTVLINEAHGETPYLALKGHVSSVSTTVGTDQGTYVVTIRGEGYEKILNRNEVFFEDVMFREAPVAQLMEHAGFYVNMSPPRAAIHMINRWNAKQVIIGPPTNITHWMFNVAFHPPEPSGEEPPVEPEPQENLNSVPENSIFKDGAVPTRGMLVRARPLTENPVPLDSLRVFTPINYLDTTRISEIVRVQDISYNQPSVEAIIATAVQTTNRDSVMANVKRVAGAGQFFDIFVNEAGKVIYRLTFEGFERTPNPEYTPIIQDDDVLSRGSTFVVDDSELSTLVDVRPIGVAGAASFTNINFIGRAVHESMDSPPIQPLDPHLSEEMLSTPLFRHGLRTLMIDDIYANEAGGAKRKARMYHQFYGQPIKKAKITVMNNTAYRVGETALVCLQKVKRRSKTLINLGLLINWIKELEKKQELLEMYIGVDTRLLNKDFYVKTATEYTPIPDSTLYQQFVENPHKQVATWIRLTLEHLLSLVQSPSEPISLEIFPNCWWFHNERTGKFKAWDENITDDESILELHDAVIRHLVAPNQASIEAIDRLTRENDSIVNALKLQNFRATSYHIDAVSHHFQQDSEISTSLSLNHGQDCIVLLEPRNFLPVGFLSVERKMMIHHKAFEQLELTDGGTLSPIQKMYQYQFQEDKRFKEASFLHNASKYRNSAAYMHRLAINSGLSASFSTITNESPAPPPDALEQWYEDGLRDVTEANNQRLDEYARSVTKDYVAEIYSGIDEQGRRTYTDEVGNVFTVYGEEQGEEVTQKLEARVEKMSTAVEDSRNAFVAITDPNVGEPGLRGVAANEADLKQLSDFIAKNNLQATDVRHSEQIRTEATRVMRDRLAGRV